MTGPHQKGDYVQSIRTGGGKVYGIVIAAGERRFHVLWDSGTRDHYSQDYTGLQPAEWPDMDQAAAAKIWLTVAARMAR